MFKGGEGLLSTAADFLRLGRMLQRKGAYGGEGEEGGAERMGRLLGRKTVELMTSNHLPGGADMASMGQPKFTEMTMAGVGFGLGVSVMLDPPKASIVGTAGEFFWGGYASTAFWCDPAEEMIVLFLTQLIPSSAYPIRRQLRVATYQAVVD